MKECVFCQIARGEIGSEIFYEDPEVIGLMDICPDPPGSRATDPSRVLRLFR
jgi:diadenosine tetraphosphate (Ap4A) HIT family hydrolase